jgi:hypothetical protein
MKNTFTLLLFLLVAQSSFAQKIRFTDSTNVWNVYNFGLSPSDPGFYQNWVCSYTGDSVINGLEYKITQFGVVREDTLNSKIFIRFFHPGLLTHDTIERLLYDYNWQVGDTVVHTHPSKTFTRYITAIDSTQINGLWHRVWHFKAVPGEMGDFNVIEGIGSAKGPWFPVYPYEFENVYYLSCFHNNGGKPTINPVVKTEDNGYNFDNIKSCTVGIETVKKQTSQCRLVPNPPATNSIIQFPGVIVDGSVSVINQLGQISILETISNVDHFKLNIGNLIPGIYHYCILDKQRDKVLTGKFIYQP